MNKQQMFNRAVNGLASQRWKKCEANNGNGNHCVYRKITRTGNEMRCSYGWNLNKRLLDKLEKHEKENKEGVPSGDVIDDWNGPVPTDGDRTFVRELQEAHDESCSANEMRQNFKDLAEKYGLKLPDALS